MRTGEAIWQAREKCPGLVLRAPNFKRYLRFARMMREIYAEYTDYIEPFGLDEAWLDVTGHHRSGEEIANDFAAARRRNWG